MPGIRKLSPRLKKSGSDEERATLVAQTAYELFADPALVEAAWAEFRGS